jgi:adenosylcobinamide kinase / adenosylcobinamide-phosphate guanylyltransferase
MGKLTFITGGCRSGKSTLALDLAKKRKGRTAFVATCVGFDRELRCRIRAHKGQRPAGWQTFEEPDGLSRLLPAIANDFDTVIIDCATLYITNLLVKKQGAKMIEGEMNAVIAEIRQASCDFFVVSNEVGSGIVPATALGRKFRDIAGGVNKSFAAAADRVFFMVSGIAMKVK